MNKKNNIFLYAIDYFFIMNNQEIEENDIKINENDLYNKLDLSFLNTNDSIYMMEYLIRKNDNNKEIKNNKEKKNKNENENENDSLKFLNKFQLKRKIKSIKNERLIKIIDFLINL